MVSGASQDEAESAVTGDRRSRAVETGDVETEGTRAHRTAITASFTIPSSAFEVGRTLATVPVERIEFDTSLSVGEPARSRCRVETTEGHAVEAALRSVDSIDAVTRIDDADETRFEIQWATDCDGFIGHLSAADARVEGATGTPEKWRFECRFETGDELSAFHEACSEDDIVVEVNRLRHASDSHSVASSGSMQ